MSEFENPFFFAMWIALALLMENKAVSAEEKNPESKRRTLKITICSNSICVSSIITYLIKVVLFSLSGKSLCQGQRLWGAVAKRDRPLPVKL
jgi:hypothetical protein